MKREFHFLPFNKANRNEVFSSEDISRVAPAYTKTTIAQDPESDLKTLREYFATYRAKAGKSVPPKVDKVVKPDKDEETKQSIHDKKPEQPTSMAETEELVFPDKNQEQELSS